MAAARSRVVQARAAVAAAATPSQRREAAGELAVAQRRLRATAEPAPAGSGRRSAAAPSAKSPTAASPAPASPEVLGATETQQQPATLSRAYSYVEEAVPGRSTGLLVALLAGIVALLVLIAREWIR